MNLAEKGLEACSLRKRCNIYEIMEIRTLTTLHKNSWSVKGQQKGRDQLDTAKNTGGSHSFANAVWLLLATPLLFLLLVSAKQTLPIVLSCVITAVLRYGQMFFREYDETARLVFIYKLSWIAAHVCRGETTFVILVNICTFL